ncbi:MAG: protein kinase [Polyangiaceae bacterium]
MLVPEDDRNDIVKLVDFGIGKIVSGRLAEPGEVEDQTRVGLLLGSPRHMAPEQIRCEKVEVRTDLYGLGVIFFQALTGHLPFDGRTEVDVLMAHCSLPPPALHDMCPDQFFPESLAQLVKSLLAKHPSGRPTVEEFLQRLSAVEEEVFGNVGLAGPTLQSFAPGIRSVPPSNELAWDRSAVTQAEWKGAPTPSLFAPPTPSVPPHSLAAEQRRKRGIVAAVLGGVALLLVVGFTVMHLRGAPAEPSVKTTEAAKPAPVEPAVPPPAKAEPAAFSFTIGSVPAPATVSESGVALGATPLTLSIARDSVQNGPRKFVVERDGFAPYTIEQGDSDSNVNVSAVLLSVARKNVRARASRSNALPTTSPAIAAPVESFTPKRSDGVVLDIRPRR